MDEYIDIITKCKFIAKPDSWFVTDSEAKLLIGQYSPSYKPQDQFKVGWSLFEGITNESYKGYIGSLPREDRETCLFEEFFIYDQYNNDISELTLSEYKSLLRDKKIDDILE